MGGGQLSMLNGRGLVSLGHGGQRGMNWSAFTPAGTFGK